MKLTPEQEEWATYYANYLETDHVKNKIFNKNFFEDWLKVLNPDKRKEVRPALPSNHLPLLRARRCASRVESSGVSVV